MAQEENKGAGLETLPAELAIKIAKLVDSNAIINLSLTSKALHSMYYDADMFKYGMASGRSQRPAHRINVDAIEVVAGDNTAVWARYAMADENARRMITPGLSNIVDCSPWIAEIFLVSPFRIVSDHFDVMLEKTDQFHFKRSFFLALVCTGRQFGSPRGFRNVLFRAGYRTTRRKKDASLQDLDFVFRSFCDFAVGLRALANLPLRIPNMMQFASSSQASELQLPRPYDNNQVFESWYLQQIDTMFNQEFIEDGEWQGYCALESFLSPDSRDKWQVITNVNFSVARGKAKARIRVRADDVGPDRRSLAGVFEKIETGNISFQWTLGNKKFECHLTPFGIVGFDVRYYGPTRHSNPLRPQSKGWIWLWKKKWTE